MNITRRDAIKAGLLTLANLAAIPRVRCEESSSTSASINSTSLESSDSDVSDESSDHTSSSSFPSSYSTSGSPHPNCRCVWIGPLIQDVKPFVAQPQDMDFQ